jgi:hypothetical protein
VLQVGELAGGGVDVRLRRHGFSAHAADTMPRAQTNALWPVTARPTISVLISRVPSYE